MSLLEDIQNWYKNESRPPEGGDLDEEFVDGKFVDKGTNTKQVSYEVLDSAARWGNSIRAVYHRAGDETPYVAVDDIEPATEMQSWGDYGDPTIFEVVPMTVTVTKYKAKEA